MKKNAGEDENHCDKAAVEHYRQKIAQIIESDPIFVKKAARILSKMIREKKGSQK